MTVKRVAIIGGGPSGIASLYELTRTRKDGLSLFGTRDVSEYEKKGQLAYDKVTLFERNSSVGGAWSDSVIDKNKDPQLPDIDPTINYSDPKTIYFKPVIPVGIENATEKQPIITPPFESRDGSGLASQWHGTGVYEKLFTNVPAKYMSFSFDEYDYKKVEAKYPKLKVLQPGEDVGLYLKKVTERNNLTEHIRLNTNVENVRKLENGHWVVTVRQRVKTDSNTAFDKWYQEEYDAVIIGNGKTVPNIPVFDNLRQFLNKNNSRSEDQQALITHTKSIPNPVFLKEAKKILFIGSSVSAADLLQYAFPRKYDPSTVFVSRKTEYNMRSEWIDFACYSAGVTNKPTIRRFLPDINGVEFEDGSVELDFDVILFATGYHMYYPFIDDSFFQKHGDLVTKFYKYTFSLADPTLALVGNTYAAFFFNRVEAQAAALASVWAGFSNLPSSQEQQDWVDNLTSKLKFFNIKKTFVDPLMELALPTRPNPFDINGRYEHVRDISEAKRIVEAIFFELKEGQYLPDDLFEFGGDKFEFDDGFLDKLNKKLSLSRNSSTTSTVSNPSTIGFDEPLLVQSADTSVPGSPRKQ